MKWNELSDQSRLDRSTHDPGEGLSYKSELTTRSFGSRGLAQRVRGHTTGRIHHLLSNLEVACFHLLDWSDTVIDIREQYPLYPVSETHRIADALQIRHPLPVRRKRGRAVSTSRVMTSDFRVTFSEPGAVWDEIFSVKASSELGKKRTLEKLQIEKQYWRSRSIRWKLVTEHELPETLVLNLKHLHIHRENIGREMNHQDTLLEALYSRLRKGDRRLGVVCAEHDRDAGLSAGASIGLVWKAIGSKKWTVDLNEPLSSDNPLVGLRKTTLQLM